MRRSRLCSILLSLLFVPCSYALDSTQVTLDTTAVVSDSLIVLSDTIITPDTAAVTEVEQVKPRKQIYQGVTVKLDIASPAIVAGMSRGRLQHYEMAVNVRLMNHFYPTLEFGYAGGRTERGDTLSYNAHGGFFRVGLDVNPLRKHPESPHALLIGIRVGTGFQPTKVDCWGEIVAGCQVEIAKVGNTAFYMGWQGRFKFLFTRQAEGLPAAEVWPIYIPGYGSRGDTGWGASYHLGWRF